MAADIMLLANTIVYDGRLRCGAESVAEAVLDLQVAPSQLIQPDWLTQVGSASFCATPGPAAACFIVSNCVV